MKTTHDTILRWDCDSCQEFHQELYQLDSSKPNYKQARESIIGRLEEHIRWQHREEQKQ